MKIGAADPAQVKRQLEDLRAQLLNAQADARRAQRELAEKLRQQSETARALTPRTFPIPGPDGGTGQRVITFSIDRDSQGKKEFVKTYGLDFVEADPVLRSQLEIPDGEGLVVVAVTPGGLADKAGIKEMDLIAKVDLQPVANVARARDLIVKGEKKSIYLDLYREGKPLHLSMDRPEPPAGSFGYWIGVSVAPVDATLRSHLGSLLGEGGLIVTDVDSSGPAKPAGIQKNDILIRVDDQTIRTQAALTERVLGSEGRSIKIDLLRAGKGRSLALIPAKRTKVKATTFDFKKGEALYQLNFDLSNPYLKREPGENFKLENSLPWTIDRGQADSKTIDILKLYTADKELSGQLDDLKQTIGKLTKDSAQLALTVQIEELREAIRNLTKELAEKKRSSDDK